MTLCDATSKEPTLQVLDSVTVALRLYGGQLCLLDAEDVPKLPTLRWSNGDRGFVRARIKGKTISIHRLIMNPANRRRYVDHINGNRLDNRKANLRICNHWQNLANSPPRAKKNPEIKYKGVTYRKPVRKWTKPWTATFLGRRLGTYRTQEEAAKAYDAAAKRKFGEFARLNIPSDSPPPP